MEILREGDGTGLKYIGKCKYCGTIGKFKHSETDGYVYCPPNSTSYYVCDCPYCKVENGIIAYKHLTHDAQNILHEIEIQKFKKEND